MTWVPVGPQDEFGPATQDFIEVATFLNENLPSGDEKDFALSRLQEAAMWSNASVAINQELEGLQE